MQTGKFTSDLLLGAKHLSERERRELGEFFADVAEQRGFPLHTAVLWNLLYFGYDLKLRGYLGSSPHITQAVDGDPIPVGAFVDVPPEATPIFGEVVYKEQRDPGVDLDGGGNIDPELSGRRAAIPATHTAVRVPEILVLDYNAFGNDFHGYGQTEFDRFIRRGWIDENLHRHVTATYEPDVPTDDLSVFVRYVLDTYGDDLFAEFSIGIGSFSLEDRRDLLLTSLAAIDEIASASGRLIAVGDYHVSQRAYFRTVTADDEEPLGGRLFQRLVRRVADIPARHSRCYTAVGAMVHDLAQQVDDDDGARELVRGTRYARTVAHLNTAIAKEAGTKDGIHLRLDDDGTFGGVWRAERLNGRIPAHARVNPLVPLGLGYAEAAAQRDEAVAPPQSGPLILDRDEAAWTVVLRQVDIDYGDLPLSAKAVTLMNDPEKTMLDIGVDGEKEKRGSKPVDSARRLVREIEYPTGFFPGIRLQCSVAWNGNAVRVRAHRLAVPVEIEGMSLEFEFDEKVFRQQMRLASLPESTFRGARSLADRIATAFRQRGRRTDDGGWALSAEDLIHALYGPEATPEEAGTVLIALGAMDLDFVDGERIWRPRLSRRTSARERARIRSARTTEIGKRLASRVQTRLVGMHLRYLAPGWNPSKEKLATYEAALRQNKVVGRWPRELPTGATWVRPFRIGRYGEEPAEVTRELANEGAGS